MTQRPQRVSIRPGVAVLSVLRHLNYRSWYAIAEFVDNSIQSYRTAREALKAADGPGYRLTVQIELDPRDDCRISIRDNAAGISQEDYQRAFRPAEVPPDTTGLSEFGMGMKSAACWFAPQWSVRTKALGETQEKFVRFDIERIVRDELEELDVTTDVARQELHYTELVLENVYHPLQTKTIGKIRDHLASIYRVFVRHGELELWFDGDPLTFAEPPVLTAPHFKKGGDALQWRKDIEFDLGNGMHVRGFAALRDVASTSKAGFALFRRDRLIVGSSDEGYRPEEIFLKSNSYTYQRLFGELHLAGFEVSHTKDGFRWDENEAPFLELLKEHLNADPLPLLSQAEGYRARASRAELQKGAELATQHTAGVIERDVPPVLEEIGRGPVAPEPPADLPPAITLTRREVTVELNGLRWQIILELSNDPAIGPWVELFDSSGAATKPDRESIRRVGVRLSIAHPFMERFGGTSAEQIEPLLRIAAAIGLAETEARDSGVRQAGRIRKSINELLRGAFSKP